jgi:DNA-binding XRE family transcriptional regulator
MDLKMKQSEILKTRKKYGHTQKEAANLCGGMALRTYVYWEKCAYKIPEYKIEFAVRKLSGK